MARDKKRRPKRRPEADSESPRARDMNIDDASIDESGVTDPVAAPDPLKNISAEVDQAKAAETGATRGDSGEVQMGWDARDGEPDPEPGPTEAAGPGADDRDGEEGDDFEHAPDELERDIAPDVSGRVAGQALDPSVLEEQQAAGHPRKQRGKVITFLGHCVDELRRVQWPDRRQVGQATAVVLGFVVLAGGYLGLMDAIWKPIVQAII
jgi:preprotein translocase SecE subunit